jgi:hypothetical protein
MSLAGDALPFPSYLSKQMQLGYVVMDIDAALRSRPRFIPTHVDKTLNGNTRWTSH